VKLKSMMLAVAILLMTACAKQTPEMPPNTALMTNIKTGIHIGQVAATSTRDALPALLPDADAEDKATANSILSDVDKGLAALDKTLAPYTSFDASNQQAVKQGLADTVDLLRQLQKDRVTHIKNPKLEARVNLGLDLATGALALWQPSVAAPPAPAPS
jgi:hypothetical protein